METPEQNRNIFAIKKFLNEYLDLRKDKDNELETVDSIRKGVESDICHLHGVIRSECQFHCRNYRCYVDFPADGSYHGGGAFRWFE